MLTYGGVVEARCAERACGEFCDARLCCLGVVVRDKDGTEFNLTHRVPERHLRRVDFNCLTCSDSVTVLRSLLSF